jgi:hypothetical protein
MSAECDGVLKGGDEHFAVRAGSQMAPYLSTNVGREFVIDIGGQLPEKIHAIPLSVAMAVRRWPGLFPRRRRFFLRHECKLPGL